MQVLGKNPGRFADSLNMEARKKINAARLACVDPLNQEFGFQYFADTLYSANYIESYSLETMGIDKHLRIYYNPKFVLSLTIKQLAAVLAHEVMHWILKHADRCESGGYRHSRWNVAADLEINDCPKLKRCLPDDCLQAENFQFPEGKLAEWYYSALCKAEEEEEEDGEDEEEGDDEGEENGYVNICPTGKPDDGDGDSDGDEEGEGSEESDGQDGGESGEGEGEGESGEGGEGKGDDEQPDSDSDSESGSGSGSGRSGSGVGQGNCGSGADGQKREWELPPPEDGGPAGLDEVDSEILRKKMAETILRSSDARGDLPAGAIRILEEMLKPPTISWQQKLLSAARRAEVWVRGHTDYSYRTPSYRQSLAQPGMILAGTVSPDPNIMVVVDTSGSVSQSDLAEYGSELTGILKHSIRQTPRIVSCDSRCGEIQEVRRIEDIQLTGGGGTDMRVGINLCLEQKSKPNIIIVFTDGYTPWPEEEPEDVKIIACIGGRCSRDSTPDWMDSITLNGEN